MQMRECKQSSKWVSPFIMPSILLTPYYKYNMILVFPTKQQIRRDHVSTIAIWYMRPIRVSSISVEFLSTYAISLLSLTGIFVHRLGFPSSAVPIWKHYHQRLARWTTWFPVATCSAQAHKIYFVYSIRQPKQSKRVNNRDNPLSRFLVYHSHFPSTFHMLVVLGSMNKNAWAIKQLNELCWHY